MSRKIILTGVIFGVTAIVFGAFGAHALKEILTAEELVSFKTAVNYQMYHAFFLLIFGLLFLKFGGGLAKSIYLTCATGVLFFSGSIYFLVLSKHFGIESIPKFIGLITPIGGLLLVVSWILLGVYALKQVTNDF